MSIAPAPPALLPRARIGRRATIIGAVAAAAVLLSAGPALAHIRITPDSVAAGSAAVLTLQVPNEEAHADTVKVDVQIPTDHPIAQLLVEPVPGWSVAVHTITLAKPITTDDGTFNQAVSEVIWSGGRIRPGQFQSFTISADPMPTGISQLAFKAIQTYSNGDIVRWIDLPQSGQPAPDHPAPTVALTTATAPAGAVRASAAPAGSGTDGYSRALAVVGLLVALLAGLLALTAVRQARRLSAGIRAPAGSAAAMDRVGTASEQASDRLLAGAKGAARRDQAPAGTKTSARRDHAPASTKASGRQRQPRRRG
jgi:periplasmic copper chaperone A